MKKSLINSLQESILQKVNVWTKKKLEKFEDKGYEKLPFEPLTPTDFADNKELYSRALLTAIDDKRILNIAISGTYGSGKSSILKTFEKEYSEKYKLLNISLATFNKDVKSNSNKCNTEKNQTIETGSQITSTSDSSKVPQTNTNKEERDIDYSINQRIELSVLQQILYQEKPEKTPGSRLRRIKNKNWIFLLWYSICITLWFVSLIVLFEFDFLVETDMWERYIKIDNNDWLLDISLVVFLSGLAFILYKLISLIIYKKITKVSVKDTEIELDNNDERSILNRYLDEIVYFFDVTNYSVVIIEDLDRFDNFKIFEKLREINIILNKTKFRKPRKITFIYATCDYLFSKENRTKFFDLVIPVVPIIDNSNSEGMFLKKLGNAKIKSDFTEQLINTITLYIEDMRCLNNIINEYLIYKNVLNESELNHDMLLSLIAYKNYAPEDFANTYFGKSNLALFFTRIKSSLLEAGFDEFNKDSDSIKKQLNELREKLNRLMQIDPNDIDEDDIMDRREKEDEITVLENNLEKVNISKRAFATYSLKDLLKTSNIEELWRQNDLNPEEKENNLLIELVSQGYINEDYNNHISLFHPGSISYEDKSFIRAVKNNKTFEFNRPLKNIEGIINNFHPHEFGNYGLYNSDILDFLLLNNKSFQEKYDRFFITLSDQNTYTIKFIEHYISTSKNVPKFIYKLCKVWPGIWPFIEDNLPLEKEKLFISIEKYTSILIQKYTKLICFTTPSKSFLGYPKKDFEGVVIFA